VAIVHTWSGELPQAVKDNFFKANAYFDTVRLIHDDTLFADSSELWRIERKLWTLNKALIEDKHAKKGAFEDLEAKLDTLLGHPFDVPEDIDAYFDTADIYFDSVDIVHRQVGGLTPKTNIWFEMANEFFDSVNWVHENLPFPEEWQNIEWKIHYLKHALKNQKEGKRAAFLEIEAKLDTLLAWQVGLPEEVEIEFKRANAYFDSVNWVHWDWEEPETIKVEQKLDYLKMALRSQKHAKHMMFVELEFKLDSLLHRPFEGLPEEVESLFSWANAYFDSVNFIHDGRIFPDSTEPWKIMQKLHYLKYGLKLQKDAMWIMFSELEDKLDILAGPRLADLPGLPPEVDSLFALSNAYFDSVNWTYYQTTMPIPWRVEWMIHYLKHALQAEKDAKWMAFDELKRKAYEFDKLELKLYYLNKGLEYQKHAKRRVFEELERKLDLLLGQEYQGLPEEVTAYLDSANIHFGVVDELHWFPEIPELGKMELKLYYLKEALRCQKHATELMFVELNEKVNGYAQIPDEGLDPDIVADFDSANSYFALIDTTHDLPIDELKKMELKIFYLSQALQFEKDAKKKTFARWKRKLFEFDKVEKKLYYLGKGSKYQKDAKWRAFRHLEWKLDSLFILNKWDPIGFPPKVNSYFDSANVHFDGINAVHFDPTIPELEKIMIKIDLLKRGFQDQKEACWMMFENLELKLDSLLGRRYQGLPDTVNMSFDSANYYYHIVNVVYGEPVPPEGWLEKIEAMLHYLTKGLKFDKDAKWMMFDELELKIDSLWICPCGDANGDSTVTIGDAVYLARYLFRLGPAPVCPSDVNCDGKVDVADIVYLVRYLFRFGPAPCDPTGDGVPDC